MISTHIYFLSEVTNTHPTLSLARTMMYIFILFATFWNLRANGYLYRHDPVFDDPLSDHFCLPAVYWLTFVLVLAFDLVFGAALFIWVSAILAGTSFFRHQQCHSTAIWSIERNDAGSVKGSNRGCGCRLDFCHFSNVELAHILSHFISLFYSCTVSLLFLLSLSLSHYLFLSLPLSLSL